MISRPRPIIVPQYAPPRNLSVMAAAELVGEPRRAVAAQLIDLAVRRAIEIARPAEPSRRRMFDVRVLVDPSELPPDEAALVRAVLVPTSARVGDSVMIARRTERRRAERIRDAHRQVAARLVVSGFAVQAPWIQRIWRRTPLIATAAAEPIIDHLWGLRDYLDLAEKDRLAFLQSPEGALRREDLDGRSVFRLNERLLPYAVIFGMQDRWARELELTAEQSASIGAVDVDALAMLDLLDGLTTLADAADALDGLGSFFGGLGDALSNIDIDIPFDIG